MGDILQGDRPWEISVHAMRLNTIERRIDEALDRVEKCAEELKQIERQPPSSSISPGVATPSHAAMTAAA